MCLLLEMRDLSNGAQPAQCPFHLTLSLQRITRCASAWKLGLGPQRPGHSTGFSLLSDAGLSTNETLREARDCCSQSIMLSVISVVQIVLSTLICA